MPYYWFKLDEERATEEQKRKIECICTGMIYSDTRSILEKLGYKIISSYWNWPMYVKPGIKKEDIQKMEQQVGFPLKVEKLLRCQYGKMVKQVLKL